MRWLWKRFRKQKQKKGFAGCAGRVLDVGSGHFPFEDATHLVDCYMEGDKERGGPLNRSGKILVVADIEALPFRDKTFEFAYASHVLEHSKDPAKACEELMRVAKAGYVETPDPFFEQGYGYPQQERGWPFHRWYVWINEGEELNFEAKSPESVDRYCDCRYASFVKKIYTSVKDLNHFHALMGPDYANTKLHWKDKFRYRVRDKVDVEK
jgi:SAM-dependent methyltransferase